MRLLKYSLVIILIISTSTIAQSSRSIKPSTSQNSNSKDYQKYIDKKSGDKFLAFENNRGSSDFYNINTSEWIMGFGNSDGSQDYYNNWFETFDNPYKSNNFDSFDENYEYNYEYNYDDYYDYEDPYNE